MNNKDRLRLAEVLLCDDVSADAEMVVAGLKHPSNDDCVAFARKLGILYRLVHPAVSPCRHRDWEAENERNFYTLESEMFPADTAGAVVSHPRKDGE